MRRETRRRATGQGKGCCHEEHKANNSTHNSETAFNAVVGSVPMFGKVMMMMVIVIVKVMVMVKDESDDADDDHDDVDDDDDSNTSNPSIHLSIRDA
uniref:Transmembrane protein n=1 Tax=Setaria digitata TaxID=48799 RepID=A0A915PYR3_9BILA